MQRWHRGVLPYEYHDQSMDVAAAHALCDAADPVQALCGDVALWGSAAGNARLVDAVRGASEKVTRFVEGAPA